VGGVESTLLLLLLLLVQSERKGNNQNKKQNNPPKKPSKRKSTWLPVLFCDLLFLLSKKKKFPLSQPFFFWLPTLLGPNPLR